MTSYYDLVELLHSFVNEPPSETFLNNLDNLNIDLRGDRYFRFIDHLTILISERLENSFYNFENKMINTNINRNNFTIEFREILHEIDFCKRLASCKLVLDENREEFLRTIRKSINNILDRIKELIIDNDDFILEEIDKAYEVM